jgi:hypothetical protein
MESSGRKNYLRSLFSSPNHNEVCCIYAKYVEFLDYLSASMTDVTSAENTSGLTFG